MRLATVFDVEANVPRPVFELPGGERIELSELFRAEGSDGAARDAMPLYFTDLAKTVQYMDDVVDAVRQWATLRSNRESSDRAGRVQDVNALPFCPPIPEPRTLRSFNAFEQHVKTTCALRGERMDAEWYDEPSFVFGNAGSLVGHQAPVHAPLGSRELDFGLQLGAIIGRGGRDIDPRLAWNHVAGFTIIDDFAARDLGTSKGKDFATAVGPYLVTLDALRDRIDSAGRIHLNMIARLNGRELSRADAASMHFNWPQLIAHASRDAELYSGDLIASGTVGGGCILELIATTTQEWLKPGDLVELEVERLGVLRTPIIARPRGAGRTHAGHKEIVAV